MPGHDQVDANDKYYMRLFQTYMLNDFEYRSVEE